MSESSLSPNPKLLDIGARLKREISELEDREDLLGQRLVYPLFGELALQLQEWMTTARGDVVDRTFALVNEWCALDDGEVDNLLQTGLFEVLADREDLRERTVALLNQRGRFLYAEIVEFFWGEGPVRALGLEPPGTWGK